MKSFFIFLTLFVFLISTWAYAGIVELPQTGQITCYDEPGNLISCTGTGQDGEFRAGVEWPNPRFTISGDCLIDNLTGLMWPQNGDLPNSGMNWEQAINYANNLDLCGYTDWWLPNIRELESLVNSEEPYIATWLNSQGFYNVQQEHYWSSTSYPDPGYVRKWTVSMDYGFSSTRDKNNDFIKVLPVRVGQNGTISFPLTGQKISYLTGDDGDLQKGVIWPVPRFIDNEDGTVTDNLTGLMWLKDANCFGAKIWQDALNTVADFNINPNNYNCQDYTELYSDWRLANRKELYSLIDFSQYEPALPTGHPFTNVQPWLYWSSTTVARTKNKAWTEYIYVGDLYSESKSNDTEVLIWPVRGGQIAICTDNDDDGYGNPGDVICYNGDSTDCDDNDSTINPGMTEIPYNDKDDDCNAATPDDDLDGDGYGIATDCNDNDPGIYPDAPEIKHDGIDQDCNGYDLTIDITKAEYSVKNDSLKVEATSSLGQQANLELIGYGTMKWFHKKVIWKINVDGIGGNPGNVTVCGIEGCDSAATTEAGGGHGGNKEGKGKTCSDGIDNDGDGQTDCNDTDCSGNRSCR